MVHQASWTTCRREAAMGLNIGGTSTSNSSSQNSSSAHSVSTTNGTGATSASRINAQIANNYAHQMWQQTAEYNAEEAAKQRAWLEMMANTVYQRTVKDMKEAGINPVLAAGMGLGTASVSGGSAASASNPMSYMAQSYPDSYSESNSASQGSSHGESESANGLAYLASAIMGMIEKMNGGNQINVSVQGFQDWAKDNPKEAKKVEEALVGDTPFIKWYKSTKSENTAASYGNYIGRKAKEYADSKRQYYY